MEIERVIEEVLKGRRADEKMHLMADVIRVLTFYHGVLWMDEIKREIASLRATVGVRAGRPIDDEILRGAIDELAGLGILSYEERVRSTLDSRGGAEDLLVKLRNREEVLSVVMRDPMFRRYLAERERVFGRIS